MNLGCGIDYLAGFVNVDARDGIGADLVHDITKPFPYPDNSVSDIIAKDIIEHLTLIQQQDLFKELYRLLIPGGKLWLRTPDLDDIWYRFETDPDTRNLFLYGDTSEMETWGAHKSGHTLLSLATLAGSHGFILKKHVTINTNLELEFTKGNLPILKGVIFINQSLGLGGAEQFNQQLLSWLMSRGVPIRAFVYNSDFKSLLQSKNIPAQKIPLVVDLIGDWKGFLKGIFIFPLAVVYYFYLVLKNKNSGTFLLTSYLEKIIITPFAKLFGQPVVWIEFGPLESIFSKFYFFPGFLYRLVSQLPDYVIEPSKHTFNHNISQAGFSHARTKIIPCAISDLTIPSLPKISQSVYSVSRLEQGKGQDLLIAAWPEVLVKYPKAHLFFIGEGDFSKVLQKQVNDLNITSSVTFLGRVDDVAGTISPYSVGVFPSVWPLEGFGLVVLEAMAAGKPIVCSNLGPYSEVADSQSAIFVDPRDKIQLTKSIISLLANPKLSRKLSQNARKRFASLFIWDKIGPKYQSILTLAQVRSSI